MMSTFNCNICCETLLVTKRKRKQQIVCPGCQIQVCLSCQIRYADSDCMNCHLKWTESFIREHLGDKFIKEVIKPKLIKTLMIEQERQLPLVQPLVEWERNYRKNKQEARYGTITQLPPKPSLDRIRTEIFPCPQTSCRGFIKTTDTCELCQSRVCLKCQQLNQSSEHRCKTEDIQSIISIQSDAKRCPKCTANIYRTEGCNHMFCTHCCSHFDWVSGKILNNSSNGHYLNLTRYASNISTLNQPIEETDFICQEQDLWTDSISIDKLASIGISEKKSERLMEFLYHNTKVIRLAKKLKYQESSIIKATEQSYQELQVLYLLGEIDYDKWSNRVYQIHKKKELYLLYADIFTTYLQSIKHLQEQLYYHQQDDNIVNQLENLILLSNDSFQSIYREYGGNLHKIKNINDNSDIPILQT